jgi:hypothetical protein
LFARAGNDRVVVDVDTGRFATIGTFQNSTALIQDAQQRSVGESSKSNAGKRAITRSLASDFQSSITFLLASFATKKIHFMEIVAIENVQLCTGSTTRARDGGYRTCHSPAA